MNTALTTQFEQYFFFKILSIGYSALGPKLFNNECKEILSKKISNIELTIRWHNKFK